MICYMFKSIAGDIFKLLLYPTRTDYLYVGRNYIVSNLLVLFIFQAPSISSKHGMDEMEADDGSKVMFDFDQGFNTQGFTQEQVDGESLLIGWRHL